MSRARRRDRFGPPSILLGTAILVSLAATPLANAAVAPAHPSGTQPAAAPYACASTPAAAARAAGRKQAGDRATVRTDEQLDTGGQLIGRQVAVHASNGIDAAVSLPVESFVGERVGDAMVYTRAVGGRSEIHVIDLSNGCDVTLAKMQSVVRSAVLDASGSALYVHGVAGAGRRDAGVTRYALDGGSAQLVVAPLPDDVRFGLTFGTQLSWSIDGATLAVQSCGIDACRTRLLDVASGVVSMFDAPGQAALIGVTPMHLVVYGDCPGLPCSVIGIARSTGASQTLAEEAWSASIAAGEGGTAVVSIETAAGIIEVNQ